MLYKSASLALLFAGTSIATEVYSADFPDLEPTPSTTTTGDAYPPKVTGSAPYGTGNPSIITDPIIIPTDAPGGDRASTTDNCIGFTSAGISITCAATPDIMPTGYYPAPSAGYRAQGGHRGHYMRRKNNMPIVVDDDYQPADTTGTNGNPTDKRPICYKFILGYQGEHGPVAPQ